MISKKFALSFLTLILGSSTIHASENKDKIKVGSAITAGLAAGAGVGAVMPGPLPAKIIAGTATTAIVTPWLLLLSDLSSGTPNYQKPWGHITWQKKLKEGVLGAIMLGHPIATPALALTAGICLGNAISTNMPLKVLVGTTIAAGIATAGTALWGWLLLTIGASSFPG